MDRGKRLLIVDNDPDIQDLLKDFLIRQDYLVVTAADGAGLWSALAQWPVDLVILDIMLPGEDGLSLCRRLRADADPGIRTLPIIMLTAVADAADRIVGLEMGADDYLTKPFDPRELLARVRSLFRRGALDAEQRRPEQNRPAARLFSFVGWQLDEAKRELRAPNGIVVPLSQGEFNLLRAFLARPHVVLSRDELAEIAKGTALQPFERSIDVQVGRLRRKLEADAKSPQLLKTVRGGGYLFAADVSIG